MCMFVCQIAMRAAEEERKKAMERAAIKKQQQAAKQQQQFNDHREKMEELRKRMLAGHSTAEGDSQKVLAAPVVDYAAKAREAREA